MKKIKLFRNNVLIKINVKNSTVIIPDGQGMQNNRLVKTESVEVLEIGDDVNNLAVGETVMLDIEPLERMKPMNAMIGAKENSDDENCSALYYIIKDFNITGKFSE